MENQGPLLIVKALDGLSARAEATAANIANANSRTYRPMRVDFEQRLLAAARGGPEAIAASTADVTYAAPSAASREMRVDLELATAAQTGMRYAALVEILGREMQIGRAAIGEGR